MTATTLRLPTPDGTADGTLYTPDGAGPLPPVVLLSDALGYRPTMHQMAQRLAAGGYAVLLPDLFYRSQPFAPFDPKTVWGNPPERERLMKVMHALEPASAMRDLVAWLDALAAQPRVRPGPAGLVGYCMGGRLAFTAAGALPERVAAVASFHGGGLVGEGPDSPHLKAAAIKARLFFGVADQDRTCTLAQQAQLAEALQQAKVHYQLEFNPGVQHGWTVPDSAAYDEAGAERHWKRLLAFFGEALPRG